jgi:hypothetical protein
VNATLKNLDVGAMLPDVIVPSTTGGPGVSLRSGNQTLVLFRPHGLDCLGCRSFLEALRDLDGEFKDWDAKLVLVPPDTEIVPIAAAGLVVADRFGQVFYLAECGEHHDFPDHGQLVEWLKHLGTLCPE